MLGATLVRAQGIPEPVSRRAAGAAVVVRPPAGAAGATVAGCLIRKDGTTGYVLTLDVAVGLAAEVDVVLGAGTPGARTVKGEVIAVDPGRGLATVALRNVEGLPEPAPVAGKHELRETESVYVAGFPGLESAAIGAPPPVRVLAAHVASFRRDDQGTLVATQIAGDVQSGDAGAPLLDKAGRVVGVIAARVPGTQTVFALPSDSIQAMLLGDWVRLELVSEAPQAARGRVRVSLSTISGAETLRSVAVAWGRSDRCVGPREPARPDKDGVQGKAYAACRELALRRKDANWEGTFELERLKPTELQTRVLIQFKLADGGGKSRWSAPTEVRVRFEDGAVAALEGPVPPRTGVVQPAAGQAGVGGLAPFRLPATARETGRIPRQAVFARIALAPGGDRLYALDLSEARILNVRTDEFRVEEEREVAPQVTAMTLAPAGGALWICGRRPDMAKNGAGRWAGFVQKFALPGLTPGDPIPIDVAGLDLVATDADLVVVAGEADVVLVDGRRREVIGSGRTPTAVLALDPAQGWVYGIDPQRREFAEGPIGGFRPQFSTLKRVASPVGGTGADLAVSTGGLWLLGTGGSAVSLVAEHGKARIERTIDPVLSFAAVPGHLAVVGCDFDGTLSVLDAITLESLGRVPCDVALRQFVVDGGRRRVYGQALRTPIPAAGREAFQRKPGPRLADLVAIALEER